MKNKPLKLQYFDHKNFYFNSLQKKLKELRIYKIYFWKEVGFELGNIFGMNDLLFVDSDLFDR